MGTDELRFEGESYALVFPTDRPFVYLDGGGETSMAELFLLSSVHTKAGQDATTAVQPWQTQAHGDEMVFTLAASSSVWDRKVYRLRCLPHRLTYEIEVEGRGSLTEVDYFGGYSSAHPRWGSGFFWSGHRFARGFNPEPNVADAVTFDPAGGSVIDLVGAPLPGKRHWFFNSPPFCFAFETGAGWVGLGIEAGPGAHRFSEYRYHASDGFFLSLAYDGYTEIDGGCTLPRIGIDFAASQYDALSAHVAAVRAGGGGALPDRRYRRQPEWWRQPLFCGWGAQCAQAAREAGYAVADPRRPDAGAFLSTMREASSFARQEAYEGYLQALERHGIDPGTVVIDDKWQATYGDNQPDREKWPDLGGFIDGQHAAGRHVLLWLKAWDREGIPDEECIRNSAGLPLAVDPTCADYERRLRESIRRLLSPNGYDADGFKIDFTHRIPVGPGLTFAGDGCTDGAVRPYGLELMRHYLGIIHDEARSIKADALVMTHTPHPYLSGVLDMVRLNDMLDLTQLDDDAAGRDIDRTVKARARVARIACPDALIDTDNWPVRDKSIWRDYIRLQPRYGVPSLYFATHIDLTQEPLDTADFQLIKETWEMYRKEQGISESTTALSLES